MQSPVKLLPVIISSMPPQIQVLIAILSIQLGAAFAISLFSILGAVGAVFFRLAISALLLLILIKPKFDENVLQHARLLVSYGMVLAMMNWCFYESIARIPLGIAVTIEFVGPLLVAVFSSKRRLDILWIVIAFTGILILTPTIGEELDLSGVAFAALAGTGWAGFILLSKRVNKVLPGSDGLVMGMIIASIFMLPFAAAHSLLPVFENTSLIGSLIALAILSTTIPFYLEFSALKKLTPQAYGVLITLEPAVAAVIGFFALGDKLGFEGIIAIACVTVATLGSTITQEYD